MTMTSPIDNPPPYDQATSPPPNAPTDVKGTQALAALPTQKADATQFQRPAEPQMPGPSMYPNMTFYQYHHPLSGEVISSPLPPDHPEMICLQEGMHIAETHFSFLGVLAAIFWFPLGVGLCLLDRRVRCRRCGMMISDGLCS